jgi:hypothetical protein
MEPKVSQIANVRRSGDIARSSAWLRCCGCSVTDLLPDRNLSLSQRVIAS